MYIRLKSLSEHHDVSCAPARFSIHRRIYVCMSIFKFLSELLRAPACLSNKDVNNNRALTFSKLRAAEWSPCWMGECWKHRRRSWSKSSGYRTRWRRSSWWRLGYPASKTRPDLARHAIYRRRRIVGRCGAASRRRRSRCRWWTQQPRFWRARSSAAACWKSCRWSARRVSPARSARCPAANSALGIRRRSSAGCRSAR